MSRKEELLIIIKDLMKKQNGTVNYACGSLSEKEFIEKVEDSLKNSRDIEKYIEELKINS